MSSTDETVTVPLAASCNRHHCWAALELVVVVAAALSTTVAAESTPGILQAQYTSLEQTREITAAVSSDNGALPGALADSTLSDLYIIPKAYLIGAQKCGTSAAFQAFTKHPQLLRPRMLPGDPAWFQKEPPFFDGGAVWKRMPSPMLSRFPLRDGPADPRRGLVGSVMLGGGIHGRDHLSTTYGAAAGGLRFIVMVRNPTLRAFSWYEFGRRRDAACVAKNWTGCVRNPVWGHGWFHPDQANTSFYETVRDCLAVLDGSSGRTICDSLYCDGNMSLKPGHESFRHGRIQGKLHVSMITHGLFGPQLASWTEVFKPAQFGVIQLAAFHKDWYTQTQKAWRFFGLEPDPFTAIERQTMQAEEQLANVNPQNVDPHYSTLDAIPADRAAAYDLLDEFYGPYNDMFYDLMIKKGIRGGKGFKRWTGWRESFEDEMATPRSKRDLKMVPKAS